MKTTSFFVRLGFILGLTFVFLFIPKVKANSFTNVLVGYGYYDYNNGVESANNWVTYSSSNLVNYGYGLSDTHYYEINTFNIRFNVTGGFVRNQNYVVTFNWTNYHPTFDDSQFIADFVLMNNTLKCYSSSWNSTVQTGSACFSSSSVSAVANPNNSNSIIVTLTFTPSNDFYGLHLTNDHPSTGFTYYKSIGWEVYDISFTYSESSTSEIINNQNQNTQDIIDNQNQNTQVIIDSNKSCSFYDNSSIIQSGYLYSNGGVISSSSWGITTYLKIDSSSNIKVVNIYSPTTSASGVCFYNVNKEVISCVNINSLTLNQSLTIPSNASYVRFTIHKSSNKPQYQICKNGNQAISDEITNDDSSGASSDASDFFSNFTTDTYGLSSIITAPLNLIESLDSATCQPLSLPLPFVNSNLTLPCMSTIYQQHFGTFLTLYQNITFGIVAYWVIVRIFNLVKDFKNPDHDEIEVLDL